MSRLLWCCKAPNLFLLHQPRRGCLEEGLGGHGSRGKQLGKCFAVSTFLGSRSPQRIPIKPLFVIPCQRQASEWPMAQILPFGSRVAERAKANTAFSHGLRTWANPSQSHLLRSWRFVGELRWRSGWVSGKKFCKHRGSQECAVNHWTLALGLSLCRAHI